MYPNSTCSAGGPTSLFEVAFDPVVCVTVFVTVFVLPQPLTRSTNAIATARLIRAQVWCTTDLWASERPNTPFRAIAPDAPLNENAGHVGSRTPRRSHDRPACRHCSDRLHVYRRHRRTSTAQGCDGPVRTRAPGGDGRDRNVDHAFMARVDRRRRRQGIQRLSLVDEGRHDDGAAVHVRRAHVRDVVHVGRRGVRCGGETLPPRGAPPPPPPPPPHAA